MAKGQSRRLLRAAVVAVCGGCICAGLWLWSASSKAPAAGIAARSLAIQRARASDEVACPGARGSQPPTLLLVLGQSNAGNHGETRSDSTFGVLLAEGRCYRMADPLAGGTGSGGSIWTRLASFVGTEFGGADVHVILARRGCGAGRQLGRPGANSGGTREGRGRPQPATFDCLGSAVAARRGGCADRDDQ